MGGNDICKRPLRKAVRDVLSYPKFLNDGVRVKHVKVEQLLLFTRNDFVGKHLCLIIFGLESDIVLKIYVKKSTGQNIVQIMAMCKVHRFTIKFTTQ